MNSPDHNHSDEPESQETDLAAEFEALAARIRHCLFFYNKVQVAEFNQLMKENQQLVDYGLRSFRKIPYDFVKQSGSKSLQTDPPDVLAGKTATILRLYGYRLQENLSNKHYFETMVCMLDVLVKFRRK